MTTRYKMKAADAAELAIASFVEDGGEQPFTKEELKDHIMENDLWEQIVDMEEAIETAISSWIGQGLRRSAEIFSTKHKKKTYRVKIRKYMAYRKTVLVHGTWKETFVWCHWKKLRPNIFKFALDTMKGQTMDDIRKIERQRVAWCLDHKRDPWSKEELPNYNFQKVVGEVKREFGR